jgi:hypothetical protein
VTAVNSQANFEQEAKEEEEEDIHKWIESQNQKSRMSSGIFLKKKRREN